MAELTQRMKDGFFPMAEGIQGGNNGNHRDKGTEDRDKTKLRTVQMDAQDGEIQVAAVRGPKPPAPPKAPPPQNN